MNGNGSSSNRPAEVQLGARPVESAPAPKNGFQAGPWPKGPAFPEPITISEADRSYLRGDQPLGTPEWVPSAETILESYQGVVVVIEVGKDSSLPARPGRTT